MSNFCFTVIFSLTSAIESPLSFILLIASSSCVFNLESKYIGVSLIQNLKIAKIHEINPKVICDNLHSYDRDNSLYIKEIAGVAADIIGENTTRAMR